MFLWIFGNQQTCLLQLCLQVMYEVQLENGVTVMVVLYLVYAVPSNQCCQTDVSPQQRSQAAMHDGYQWNLVTRSGCCFTPHDLCRNDCVMQLHMHPLVDVHKPKHVSGH